MNKRLLLTLGTLLIIAIGTLMAFFLVKGYTFSPKEGRLLGTGLISVTSAPDGASVYIDGHLATATNATLSNLAPKTYDIKIVKEGLIPWEKKVDVSEGLVTEIKATLFPALPTFYPLTVNGVENPVLSSDGQKLAFGVPVMADSHVRQKGGIWVWTMTNQPIAFARSAEPHQLVSSTETLDFSKAKMRFSPDSTQVLVTLYEGDKQTDGSLRNYLLPVDKYTGISDLRDITPMVAGTWKEWDDTEKQTADARVFAIQDLSIRETASKSSELLVMNSQPITNNQIKWSPDETKFIVIGGGNQAKLYDLSTTSNTRKPDQKVSPQEQITSSKSGQVPLLGDKEYALPEALAYYWLPDSKHIILVQKDKQSLRPDSLKIAISELDGGNVSEIFAGSFSGNVVFPWPDSSRLVVLTSFATSTASKPNLFGINLK